MKVITVQQYQTSDGELFTNAADAAAHEEVTQNKVLIADYLEESDLTGRGATQVLNRITHFLAWKARREAPADSSVEAANDAETNAA